MNVNRNGSPDARGRRGVPAARRDRRRARHAGAVAPRAPAWRPAVLDAGNTAASRRLRHHFDCVQNSESARGLQDTVPHWPGRELHPHKGASMRRKEYRRARMRVRRAGCANVAACDAREARCDIGAQGAGSEPTGRGARDAMRRARIGASAQGGSVRGRVRPGRARTATGAWRAAAGEAGGLHGAGRTWPNRDEAAASVGERHRKFLPCDLLHVG